MSTRTVRSADLPLPPKPPGAERYGAWFDHDAADAACAFFPAHLRHTEAEWYGRPFHLQSWQANDLIRPVFGWKREDGTRLIRRTAWWVPRKNGKTELAAGVSVIGLLGDGEMGGQAYSMAVNESQARIVFEKAAVMLRLSPTLYKDVEVLEKAIYCAQLEASFKPINSAPKSKHGFSASFAVGDEVHEWPDGKLLDVVHKSTVARRQPLEILISTAGEPGIGYGWTLWEHCQAILAGNKTDPTFWPVIYAADPADDWTDPATWRKANPNYGISVKEDFLVSEVEQAKGNALLEGDFKRFHLNIWNHQLTAGLPMAHWDECPVREVSLETLRGRPCFGALDLSATTDLTALVLCSPWERGGGFDFWCHFWMPSHGIEERSRRDQVPYAQWIKLGLITATEGNIIDYDAIRAFITGKVEHPAHHGPALVEQVALQEIAFDRWNSTHLVTQLGTDGLTMVQIGQGTFSMSNPTKEFERLITAHQIGHGHNPVLRWMASCTVIESDGHDNVKPVKPDRRKSTKRIDGIVAAIMALARAIAAAPKVTRSIYETPGFIV